MITNTKAKLAKHFWVALLICTVGTWVVWLSFRQGLTWDEPWLMDRGQALVLGQPLESFKLCSGFVLAPLVKLGGSWCAARALFLGVQLLCAGCLFLLMPRTWLSQRRWLALGLLWLEPTFRERILELRTDGLVLLLMLLATLAWSRLEARPWLRGWSISWCWGLGLLLSFKTALFWGAWLLAMLCLDRGWRRGRTWLTLLGHGMLTAALLALGLTLVGRWFQVEHIGAKVAQGTPTLSAALRENHGLISGVWKSYIGQIVLIGLPYWSLASLGLGLRLAGQRQEPGIWGALEATGWVALAMSAFYFGAFPYHYVCIIPGLLPSVLGGLAWLEQRLPSKRARLLQGTLAAAVLFSLLGAWPLLGAASLSEQTALTAFASTFVLPGRSYVDGVGILSPKPKAAPFATGILMQSGQAEGLWRRWEAEHAAVFIANGRTEMLFTPSNAAWVEAHVAAVHPQVGVVGVTANSSTGSLSRVWDVPWPDEFLFQGTAGWAWRLQGAPILHGQRVHLATGPISLSGSGPGSGAFLLVLTPGAGAWPNAPAIAPPFFLPFQRRFLDL